MKSIWIGVVMIALAAPAFAQQPDSTARPRPQRPRATAPT